MNQPRLGTADFVRSEKGSLRVDIAVVEGNLAYIRLFFKPEHPHHRPEYSQLLEGPCSRFPQTKSQLQTFRHPKRYYQTIIRHPDPVGGPVKTKGAPRFSLRVCCNYVHINDAIIESRRWSLLRKLDWSLHNDDGSVKAKLTPGPRNKQGSSQHTAVVQYNGRRLCAVEDSGHILIPNSQDPVEAHNYVFRDVDAGTDLAWVALCTVALKQQDYLVNPVRLWHMGNLCFARFGRLSKRARNDGF